jgi:hypothetical protein
MKKSLGLGALVFLAIQLIPYGHNHTKPPIRQQAPWNTPETHYPWYTNVAPASWLTERDTLQGRRKLNFSEWSRPQKDGKLNPVERQPLITGLQATTSSVNKSERVEKDEH